MNTATENDLKELKDLINSRFDELKQGQINLEKSLIKIETRLETWKPAIDKIPDLAEKMDKIK